MELLLKLGAVVIATKKLHIGGYGMMDQGVLQPGTMQYGMNTEHSKGVHSSALQHNSHGRYNTH